jgi:hypothetical protein
MTTVFLAGAGERRPRIQVFAVVEEPDDRYVTAVREFEPGDAGRAEAYARRLMGRVGADHFRRTSH